MVKPDAEALGYSPDSFWARLLAVCGLRPAPFPPELEGLELETSAKIAKERLAAALAKVREEQGNPPRPPVESFFPPGFEAPAREDKPLDESTPGVVKLARKPPGR